ncbi:MAG: PQQ-binding-like beta-propeller repeat protein, partial [Gammaproteobacteria bacterium]|nr:PQQ-binding-like beta-propeller repeat protein [Gammaproteobacteria bacterium]
MNRVTVLALCAWGLTCAAEESRAVDDAAIADASNTAEWLTYGRNHNEQRFAPLDQINSENVAGLKLDWYLDVPDAVGLVSTPLVADGVMYFVGSRNIARAVDAVTGELLWTYDPEVTKHAAHRMRLAFVHGSRGLAMWGDKVFIPTIDGRLIALRAATGEHVWTATTIDPSKAMYITGAPKAFRGKVLIGNGGTENGPARGYVTAYDAETGKPAWRFYIVPGNP